MKFHEFGDISNYDRENSWINQHKYCLYDEYVLVNKSTKPISTHQLFNCV